MAKRHLSGMKIQQYEFTSEVSLGDALLQAGKWLRKQEQKGAIGPLALEGLEQHSYEGGECVVMLFVNDDDWSNT